MPLAGSFKTEDPKETAILFLVIACVGLPTLVGLQFFYFPKNLRLLTVAHWNSNEIRITLW